MDDLAHGRARMMEAGVQTACGSDSSAVPIHVLVPAHEQMFLGFDFGTKRTGIATGNRLTCTAEPLQTIRAQGDARFGPIGKLIKDWQPHALVVGVPRHPDGVAHEMTARAEKFARQLRGRFALPVYEVDERYSSVEAESQNVKDTDAQSAQIILEQFLRSFACVP